MRLKWSMSRSGEREAASQPAGARDLLAEGLVEGAAVADSGEPVGEAEPVEIAQESGILLAQPPLLHRPLDGERDGIE